MRPVRALLILLVLGLAAAAPAQARVILGSKAFAPQGRGFGTFKPSLIDNGGDPSGLADHIHWKHWGSKTARGHGRNSIFKPHGGYYRKRPRIEFRAKRLGTCPGESVRAYTELLARVPKRPGGKLGKWFRWAGKKTICSFG